MTEEGAAREHHRDPLIMDQEFVLDVLPRVEQCIAEMKSLVEESRVKMESLIPACTMLITRNMRLYCPSLCLPPSHIHTLCVSSIHAILLYAH